MSRVGKKPLTVPQGVKLQLSGDVLHVEGPKGKQVLTLHPRMKVKVAGQEVMVERPSNAGQDRSLHGLTRSLIQNAITGVTQGYTKELVIEGVGFRATAKPNAVSLTLGFSHPVECPIPPGIKVETPKPTQVIIRGADKYMVGQVAANIRRLFEPEPYKGKGIRYEKEQIRRKQGKTVG